MSVWFKLIQQGPVTYAALALTIVVGVASLALAEDKTKTEEATTGESAATEADAASEDTAATIEKATGEAVASEEEVEWEDKPYQLVDGKVDFGTYNGFRRPWCADRLCCDPQGLGYKAATLFIVADRNSHALQIP